METKIHESKAGIGKTKKGIRFNKKKDREYTEKIENKIRSKNYSYPVELIKIVLTIKLCSSCSFRAICKIISIINLYTKLSTKTPSHSTILIWTKKIGCYQLEKDINKGKDWILVIDESIQFGHEKLLVIYGLRASKIDFTRALNYQDLTPLLISARTSWTGDLINKELKKIEEKLGTILYAVADGGNGICKGLRLSNIGHVYDLSHKIAWFLKQVYSEDVDFKEYTTKMAKMRGRLVLSDVSHVLPPNQKIHSRFMNLDILSDWGEKVLLYLDKNEKTKKEYIQLQWVGHFKDLIQELSQVNCALQEIKKVLKTKGLSKANIKWAEKTINKIEIQNSRTEYIKRELVEYLKKTKEIGSKSVKMLCTSDIIESSFGKYKNYINQNPMIGITNLSLCISAFTSKLDDSELKQVMEKIRTSDISKWSEENIGQTNMAKRRRVLKKAG